MYWRKTDEDIPEMLHDNIPRKKKKMSNHDIILIIFRCCVSKIYFISLLPNLKCTEDQSNQINKYIIVENGLRYTPNSLNFPIWVNS